MYLLKMVMFHSYVNVYQRVDLDSEPPAIIDQQWCLWNTAVEAP